MIPTKIEPFFVITHEKKDYDIPIIRGDLTCCNSHEFEISTFGDVEPGGLFTGMCLVAKDEGLVFEATCRLCGRKIPVFNSTTDGYDISEYHDPKTKNTEPCQCGKCKENNFSVAIEYEYPCSEDLANLDINEANNSFTRISVSLRCNQCGKKHRGFIDYETG